MTQNLRQSFRIARRADIQGARPAMENQVAIEKSTTDKTTSRKQQFMKGKKDIFIGTLNVRTLQKPGKISELIASAQETGHDVICLQEHRFIHEELITKEQTFGEWSLITSSAWKNSVNAATGGVGILLSKKAYNAVASIEVISPRIMIATINGNPKTTVISCYSPTNVSDEIEVERFYENLTSVTRQVPKHNLLIISGDFNAHLGQSDGFKFAYHQQTNRNGHMMKDYLKENNLLCINTAFQKRPGQLWTHKSPKGTKAQLDYIIINRKWKNSVKNSRSFNSFVNVDSDHRIVSAKFRLSLRANKKKSEKMAPYDWSVLRRNADTRNQFVTQVNNRFAVLQDLTPTISSNSTFNNFQMACKETAAETIPLKPKVKKRKPWENEQICQKRKTLREAAQLRDTQPSPENTNFFNDARTELKTAYEIEQSKYLQNRINDITNASSNKKSAEAWKTVNEISGRKSGSKAKLKASSQEERINLWQKHFQELLGKAPEIFEEEIEPVITEELKVKKGTFSLEELQKAVKSMKNGKACGLDEIPTEVWKLEEFHHILLDLCNGVYKQDAIDKWTEGCLLPFPKKGDLGLTKNYRGITLTAIAAKIYNLMLLNRLRPKIDPLLRRNQNGFRTNRSTSGQILTIRRILEGVNSKNLPLTLLFIDFSKAFDSIHRGKMKEILLAYGIPKETVDAIMILYQNTRSMVRSPDGDTDFFDITAGVLQGDTLAPYIFIICLDYVLRKAVDKNLELGFTLKKQQCRRQPAKTITDADYADDLAVLTDNVKDATTLLHNIEKVAREIGLYVNAGKTEFMSINQDSSEGMKSLNGEKVKKVKDFKYLGSYIASTAHDIDVRLGKAWVALNQMDKIWKSELPDGLKRSFFRATVESVLIYGGITWTLTKSLEKKIDGSYTRMLRAALNKSWRDHLTNKELYANIPRISSTLKQQRLRFAGHCWRNKDELAGDVLLWEPTHGSRKRGRPMITYINQIENDSEYTKEELPNAMNDRILWRNCVMKCRASSTW